jgi:iron-sulfur cluster insertion protein
MEFGGIEVLVDAMSSQYLTGAEINYKEDIMGSSFAIKNPNAETSCGCGSSFSPG